MNLSQVSAVAAVLLFFAAVVTALWGTEIAGGLGGAWAHGTAQAAAEKRRLAGAAREARDSGTWQGAKAAAQSLRGAAKDAGAWARKENGPVRRVLAAAATGAYVGARGAARAAAWAARRRKAAASTAGGGSTSRLRRVLAAAVARGRNWRRPGGSSRPGQGTGSRFRSRRPLGVCDGCGHMVAFASLIAGLCLLCRRKQAPQADATKDPAGWEWSLSREETEAPAGEDDTAAGVTPVTESRPAVPLPAGGDGAAAGTVPGVQPSPQLPAPQSTSGPVPVTAGTPAAIQSATTGGAAMTAGAIGSGRPGSALAVRPGGPAALEGRVTGRPGGAVAVRGDATDHGEWVENAKTVIRYVSDMFGFVKLMTEGITAGECPDDQISETAACAETIYAYGTQMLTELVQIDKGLLPWIKTVAAHGGPRNVASPRWLQGR